MSGRPWFGRRHREWHELMEDSRRWVCRYCIALHGLKASELDSVPFAYDTRVHAQAHIYEKHHP